VAGPNLPVTVDAAYPDGTDPSVKEHQQHHDAIHELLNRFDLAAPTDGQTLVWVSAVGRWMPQSPAAGVSNLCVIVGANSPRTINGAAVPTGMYVLWVTDAGVRPVNGASGDLWHNGPTL
jgi:hypothetical protein